MSSQKLPHSLIFHQKQYFPGKRQFFSYQDQKCQQSENLHVDGPVTSFREILESRFFHLGWCQLPAKKIRSTGTAITIGTKCKKKYIMQKVKQLAIWQLGWVFSEFLGKVVMGQSQEFWDLGFQASQRPEKGQKMQYPGCTYH